jgi:hypothetical protein
MQIENERLIEAHQATILEITSQQTSELTLLKKTSLNVMALEESKRCFTAEIEQCKIDRQKYL